MSLPERIGDYEILGVLGQGGMGLVLEARHPSLPRAVALKVITSGTPSARSRFKREGQLLARVTHPNVMRVHEFGDSEQGPFLVTERVEGESLREAHEAKPLDPTRAAEVVRDLASAVSALHGVGVLHRDLKPENVLLRAPDATPVLIDFGLAFTHEEERLTRTGAMVGTPQFMAPEQIEGAVFDERVDVYGLGATLYALLAGAPPFADAQSAHELMVAVVTKAPDWKKLEGVPRPLIDVTRRCLEKHSEKRYPSAVAVQADLKRFLAGELDGGSRRVVWIGAVLLVVLFLAGLVVALWASSARSVSQAPAGPPPVQAPTSAVSEPSPSQGGPAADLLPAPAVRRWVLAQSIQTDGEGRAHARYLEEGRLLFEARGCLRVWSPVTAASELVFRHPEIEFEDPPDYGFDLGRVGDQAIAAVGQRGGIALVPISPPGPTRVVPIGEPVMALRFMEDESLLAGTNRGQVWRVDVQSGERTAVARHSDGEVSALAQRGELVLSASGVSSGGAVPFLLRTWKAETFRSAATSIPLSGATRAVAFSPDGKTFAVGTREGRCFLGTIGSTTLRPLSGIGVEGASWATANLNEDAGLPLAHEAGVSGLSFSLDGGTLYSTADRLRGQVPSDLRVWDVAREEQVSKVTFDMDLAVTGLTLAPDGRQLLLSTWNGRYLLLEPRS